MGEVARAPGHVGRPGAARLCVCHRDDRPRPPQAARGQRARCQATRDSREARTCRTSGGWRAAATRPCDRGAAPQALPAAHAAASRAANVRTLRHRAQLQLRRRRLSMLSCQRLVALGAQQPPWAAAARCGSEAQGGTSRSRAGGDAAAGARGAPAAPRRRRRRLHDCLRSRRRGDGPHLHRTCYRRPGLRRRRLWRCLAAVLREVLARARRLRAPRSAPRHWVRAEDRVKEKLDVVA